MLLTPENSCNWRTQRWRRFRSTRGSRFCAVAPAFTSRPCLKDWVQPRLLMRCCGPNLKEGLAKNRIALQALGYRQVAEYLEGARSLAETKELVKIRTNQFAKRQLTWFRRQLQLRWIHVEENALATATAEQIARDYSL